jgi:glycosyltransferase involved in cell wall biosynthesis
VLIDDGSRDATVAQIRLGRLRVPTWRAAPVTLLELTRNFGKEAAMLAGLDHVRGQCAAAVLIDSDLQHPPELIEAMVQKWRDGAEVVTAVRDDRDQESRLKVASASWFYRVFNKVVDSIQLKEGAGDYRLLGCTGGGGGHALARIEPLFQGIAALDGLPQCGTALSAGDSQCGANLLESLQAVELCLRWHLFVFRAAPQGVDCDRGLIVAC